MLKLFKSFMELISNSFVVYIKCDGNIEDYLKKQTPGSAGYDITYNGNDVILTPKEIKVINTGIKIQLPENTEAQIRPRSGMAKKGITIINTPGTIDADFRGEIGILLINLSQTNYTIKNKDRIAQIVFKKTYNITLKYKEILNKTERNEGKFGSTGK